MKKHDLVYSPSSCCHGSDPQADVEHADDNAEDNTSIQQAVGKVRERLNEYLTRRQAAEYIRDILGRPFSFSTASKLAALGEFVRPALWWGRRPLYTRDDLRAWAEARSRPTKERRCGPL
jgi:hypothetical protein